MSIDALSRNKTSALSAPDCTPYTFVGRIVGLRGILLRIVWGNRNISVGHLCKFMTDPILLGEVVGFENGEALVMPYGPTTGLSPETKVILDDTPANHVRPHQSWLGRVVDGWGKPIDGKGPLVQGPNAWPLQGQPMLASMRMRVDQTLDVGVKAINTFLTVCEGQRMGLFAGTGVGKSMLLSMLARFTACDICVIGLIGERGREVREFLEETLTPEARQNSIVVVATSDEPALLRRRAAYLTMALTEYFRDQGASVLCLFDSVSRFAMALRDIGLSLGEPPTLRGYPPSVFAELPRLLERAGPGLKAQTTAFFTVLMEGDDRNDPIADAVRGVLDGHIVLSRALADKAHFPAIYINQSISRLTSTAYTPQQQELVQWARRQLALYDDMVDLIRIQAYQAGSSAEVDLAIAAQPLLMSFLAQDWRLNSGNIEQSFAELAALRDSII